MGRVEDGPPSASPPHQLLSPMGAAGRDGGRQRRAQTRRLWDTSHVGTGSRECCRGLLFPVARISACSVIRVLSRRMALSATLSCPPSPPLPLRPLAKGLGSPQGLDSHLSLPGPGWPSLFVK